MTGPGQVLFAFVRHWSRRTGPPEQNRAGPSEQSRGGPSEQSRGEPPEPLGQAQGPLGQAQGQGRGGQAGQAEQGRLVLVTEAVLALRQRGRAATVNAVADEIGIDQSGASRLIRSAIEAGHLGPAADGGGDGRRRPVTVTAAGHEMLAHAHEWQERVFDRLTEGWPARRRRDFQQAMSELMERSHTVRG
ncbi:hypothetical protein Aab01nite_08130 [Paractinoplanes abujensis]|uniref:DNA-binding MarR family transcriptional regulator n=1 Tax=Paractinoplanes abujensis TaxID=882441 RepID=A0A7W7CMQ3_9ACTN|nr:MarR family winged helix-turn-helix transcriptional regulator [Actinoplanes abujensis]MBB4691363.1 DNA-binding MarR family transcriptional regulator [Actinoplanes abujensis]GID17223.1 hypothetical protein Aab01nite_08130 [Actinoplanes abujensis]